MIQVIKHIFLNYLHVEYYETTINVGLLSMPAMKHNSSKKQRFVV